jgi:hypothetical protein
LCDCCAANLHGAGLFDFIRNMAKGIKGPSYKPRPAPMPRREVKDWWTEIKKLVSSSDWKKLISAISNSGLDGQEGEAAIAKYLSEDGWKMLNLPDGVEGLHDYEWASDVRRVAGNISAAEYKAFKDQLKTDGMSGGGLARKMKHMAAAQPRAPVFNSGDLESFISHGRY